MFQLSAYPTYQVFLAAVLAMLAATLLFPLWIRIVRFRNIGQQVRADGPQGHLVKQGTPTMGGVLILIIVFGVYFVMGEVGRLGLLALVTTLACGLLGFADDYMKVLRERSLGLRPRTKLAAQGLIAVVFGIAAVNWAELSTWVDLPLTGRGLDLGSLSTTVQVGGAEVIVPWLYLGFIAFLITGFSNAVNLTDGLDGLAAGTVGIVMFVYAAIGFRQDHLEVALLASAVAGACIGFLWYNSFPADIFMGDTGSLGLGAAIATAAIITKTELLLVLIGGIYVIETMSVILQVTSYKITGKRVFRMAPIHHHFEMKGWSETKIMVRFWIITGILAGMGFALYFVASVPE